MSQVKIFSTKAHLDAARARISDAIHASAMEALGLPSEKRFHRFFALDPQDFVFPPNRSSKYTIIEVSMFEGRSVEAKKAFIRLLFDKLWQSCEIAPQDVEITVFETPRHNWGIRGAPGDELALNYKVDV